MHAGLYLTEVYNQVDIWWYTNLCVVDIAIHRSHRIHDDTISNGIDIGPTPVLTFWTSILRICSTDNFKLRISHLSPPFRCWWWRVLYWPFYRSLSVAHSSATFRACMTLLTASSHLKLGLRQGRFHSTSNAACILPSLLSTWPNHSNLLYLMTTAIGSTFVSS